MTTYNLTANTTSSNDSDTQNVETPDTVVVAITAAYGLSVQSSSNCSASVVGGGSNPTTVNLTVTFSSTGSYSVVMFQSFGGRTYTLTGTASAPVTITAPVISSITNNNAKAANVTATVNLSSNGSGGTGLKYAQTTSNSVPSSGWQTGNTFSHPRNTTRYYWASQDTNTSGAFDGGDSHAVGYRDPVKSLYVNDATITASATSHTASAGATGAGDQYQVVTLTGGSLASSSIVTATGSTTSLTMTNYLPSAGSYAEYIVRCRAPLSNGGDNSWQTFFNNISPSDRFRVTRQAAVDVTPDSLGFTDVTDATPSSVHYDKDQITGINSAADVKIISGSNIETQVSNTSITPSSFSTADKTVTNSQYVHVKKTASSSFSTASPSVIEVGTLQTTWQVTTRAQDATPTNFIFPNAYNVTTSSSHDSAKQITGFDGTLTASREAGSGTFAVSSSATTPSSGFSTADKTITNNQYVHVKQTASSTALSCVRTIISVGTVQDAFSLTTAESFSSDDTVAMGIYYYGISSNSSTTVTRNVPAGGEVLKLTFDPAAGSSAHYERFDNVHGSFTLTNCTANTTTNVGLVDHATNGVSGIQLTISGASGASYSCVAVFTHDNGSGTNVTKTYTLQGVIDPPDYGLECYDASGNTRLKFDKRQARLHGRFGGTGSGATFNQVYSGWGAGGYGQWFAVNTTTSGNYYWNPSYEVLNRVQMKRADVRVSNNSYQIFAGSEDYDVLVFRF